MKYQIKGALGDPNSDILSITTQKSLSAPSGTFSITFVPKLDMDSRTWFSKLDAFDYVEIEFQGMDDPESRIVMRGMIDSVNKSEDYSSGQPRRSIVISGRDLGSLLENHSIYYIPEIGKQEAMESYLKVLAWKKFFPVAVNAVEAFEFILDRFEESINVKYNKISLTERLGFTAASTFDDDRSNLFHLMGYEGPYWNAFQQYQDKPFHEIFVYDAPGKAWLVMRPARLKDAIGDYHKSVGAVRSYDVMNKALLQQLENDYNDPELQAAIAQTYAKQAKVDQATTPGIMYPDDIKIAGVDKINLSVRKQHNEVFNYYLTIPALMLLSKQEFRGICLSSNDGKPEESENPFFQIDPNYPAYIGKYGFRKLEATTYFINLDVGQLGVDNSGTATRGKDYVAKVVAPGFIQKGIQRNRMMVAWYLHNEYLLTGEMQIRGTNSAIIGTYVEDTDDNLEYYIENVSHSFVLFESFTTTLGLTRGQPPAKSKGLVGAGDDVTLTNLRYETTNPYYFSGTGMKSVYRKVSIKAITEPAKGTPKTKTEKPTLMDKEAERLYKKLELEESKPKKFERQVMLTEAGKSVKQGELISLRGIPESGRGGRK